MSFVRNASQDLVYDSGTSSYVSAYQNVSIPTNGPGPAVFVDSQGRALTYNGKALVYGEYNDLSEWTPDPDWWDIETIIGEDTRSYAGKAIILYSNSEDTTTFTISSPLVAVETSDGSFYTSTTTHTWDKTKDKPVSGDVSDTTPKYATRYVKFYFNTSNPTIRTLDSRKNGCLYALFDCDLNINYSFNYSSNGFFYSNYSLVAFDFLNNHKFNLVSGYSYYYFCAYCYALQKIPDVIDTSTCTNFSGFLNECRSLKKIPDILDTSSGTNFSSFLSGCISLRKIPDILDVSHGTNFSSFLASCYSLKKVPDVLDVSNGTSFNSFFNGCYSLEKLPDVLDLSNGTGTLYGFCESCKTLKKLPDFLDVSGFNNFQHFCYSCSSLEKLPDILDVSNGTNFNSFCGYCSSLRKLPDVLDTSNGTNFYEFCTNCYCLEKAPSGINISSLDTSNTYGIYNFFAYCQSLRELPDVLDLSYISASMQPSSLLSGCYSLVKANIKLPSRSITTLSSNNYISIDSLRYIANNAPTVTAGSATLTIGSTNISRAGGASGTIITTLTNKGWTVN